MKKLLLTAAAIAGLLALSACEDDATVASRNLSKSADMFEIERRVVFYNGITDTYMLTIEGRCSIEPASGRLEVVCKTGDDSYKKHFLGLSDNVTYFAEQIEGVNVSTYHYRVIFKPQSIAPDIDFVGDVGELLE